MTLPRKTKKEKQARETLDIGKVFSEFLKEKYHTTPEALSQLLSEKESKEKSIPVSILRHPRLSSLEVIVKFLREKRSLSYDDIGRLLNRRPKALASTYSVAIRKDRTSFKGYDDDDAERIPFSAFEKRLSVLECICTYLKSVGKSYAEISRLLGRDQRTVWTVCRRAEIKSGKSDLSKKALKGLKRKHGK